jgi:acyl-homoserine lactone acylase PvdQ
MTHRAPRRGVVIVATLSAFALLGPAAALADPPAPGAYQEDDGLGFRNIVPPGSDGLASLSELQQFLFGGGVRPEHNNDQLDEYDGIVQAAPGLTETDVDTFFKDASFGVPPGDIGETYTPDCSETTPPAPSSIHCDDVTIVRDDSYGVPHIYGTDRAAAIFAAGYVGAEDRLFFMDVERHLGRAELSNFLGGSNASTDRSMWRQVPYTEQELQAQYDDVALYQGAAGAQVKEDVDNYVDGVNQYIGEARAGNPDSPMPGEYVIALNDPDNGPDPWKVTDVIATASLVAGQFGKGGGREVDSALALEEAVEQFGPAEGRDAWEDFRAQEDPETDTTVRGADFPYQVQPANPTGTALPDPGTTVSEPTVAAPAKVKAAHPPPFRDLVNRDETSNAVLVSDAKSAGAGPLGVMGPQVGYFSPQILTELDIHAPASAEGPAIDARGVGFAGISMYVLLGRGQDYAWSATSANNDIEDTYALELCDPDNPTDPGEMTDDGYRPPDGGAEDCVAFDVMEKVNSWTPKPADPTPAGTQTLRALRSELGIVSHRAMIGGVPHAYTRLRATYMHEADSATGFLAYNTPDEMESTGEFAAAASRIDYTFNWFYVNDEDVAYFNSGANPVRPDTVDRNFPVFGEPANLWSNFDSSDVTFDRAPPAEHPQVENQDYISSWNNKQAPEYRASDDTWSYQSTHRVELLNDRVEAAIAGGETLTRAELVDIVEDAATSDLRGTDVLPVALRMLKVGKKKLGSIADEVKLLNAWSKDGAHRIDRDGDGKYEDAKAIRIMDAWWPLLVNKQFGKVLGSDLYTALQRMQGLHNRPGSSGSAFGGGWYGYVEKDLRSILAEPVDQPLSREYCADGKRGKCRDALRASLRKALEAKSNPEIYPGQPNSPCAALPNSPTAQWCWDAIRSTAIGAITQPPIDWQNRPTFQQVVEPQNDVVP